MKKLLLLLLAVLSLISCTDDSNPVEPTTPATKTVYSPKKITVSSINSADKIYNFTHDSKGNVLTIICDKDFQRTNTYDARGNKLSSVSKIYDNNSWLLYDSVNYTYDAQNNMLSTISMDSKTLMVYDNNSNLLSETYLKTSSNALINVYRYSFSYSDNNKMTGKLEEWFNGSGNNTRSSYTYNQQGLLNTEFDEQYINGSWQNSSLRTNSYSTSGELLNKLNQSWINGSWSTGSYDNYIYDSKKNLISSYDNKLKCNYKYNANNLITEIESFLFDGTIWQPNNGVIGILIKELRHNSCGFYTNAYKMTVEYAAFQVPATYKSAAPAADPLPEFTADEMTKRLAPCNQRIYRR